MMLPEDLMVLLINEQNGKLRTDSSSAENALAGAVLIELVDSGHVALEPNGKKLKVVDPTPPKDPLLAEALGRITKPMPPQSAVERVRKSLLRKVVARLQDRGVVRVEPRKVLGIFPAKSYLVDDERAAAAVRKAVGDVVHGYRGADARTGPLVTLLASVNAVQKVFDGDKRELRKRAKGIAAGNWAGDAVRKALQAVQAGVTAATSAAASGE